MVAPLAPTGAVGIVAQPAIKIAMATEATVAITAPMAKAVSVVALAVMAVVLVAQDLEKQGQATQTLAQRVQDRALVIALTHPQSQVIQSTALAPRTIQYQQVLTHPEVCREVAHTYQTP